MNDRNDKEILDISQQGSVAVVRFGAGVISGVSDIDEIGLKLREFVMTTEIKKLVIDFSGVKFFSSQMLGLLVDVWRKLCERGGNLVISGINPRLTRVFRITNLDKVFEFHPDAESAVEAVADK